MIARLAWLVAVVAVLLCPPARAADDRCNAPAGTAGTAAALSHVAPVLHPGGTLDVLVIGSATVFGPEAALAYGGIAGQGVSRPGTPSTALTSATATAFPLVMGRDLEAAIPGLAVHVSVQGARSMTAADMVELMRTALQQHPFQLVIWQTGTLEAVRNVQPGDFAQTLADGQQVVRDAGADLVLVDLQYSRFLQTNANIDPYMQAFGQAAAVPDVAWFRRYDLMRNWVSEGQIDLEHTAKADRKAVVVLLHDCLGSQLAQFVVDSARS